MAFQPREAGDICPPSGSMKRNPLSCEVGEGLTPWSHIGEVTKMPSVSMSGFHRPAFTEKLALLK